MRQRHGRSSCGVFRTICTTVIALLAAATPALPANPPSAQPGAFVVGNDRGGFLLDRLREVGALRQSGAKVEIRGAFCYSTCTMFLGLPNVCVTPQTVFGFHGPSRSGAPLPPALFEKASRVIAQTYPETLQDWYLDDARYELVTIRRRSGQDLIALGLRECPGSGSAYVTAGPV